MCQRIGGGGLSRLSRQGQAVLGQPPAAWPGFDRYDGAPVDRLRAVPWNQWSIALSWTTSFSWRARRRRPSRTSMGRGTWRSASAGDDRLNL